MPVSLKGTTMDLGMLINAVIEALIQAFMSTWLDTIWPAVDAATQNGVI